MEGFDAMKGGSPPPMPRWVKVFAVVAGIVAVLIVAVLLLGGGRHGPGRHIHDADAAVAAASDSG